MNKKAQIKLRIIIFIILIGIFGSYFVFAEIPEELTYTPSTDIICNNGICSLILYSGIRNVYEDDTWKRVEDAKSLKDKEGFEIIYLENDGTHKIDVVDFNTSSIQLDFSYDKDNLGEYVIEVEDGKMNTTFIIIETFYNETTREPYEVETKQEIEIEEDKNVYFTLNENPLGKKFKLGEKSTTIKLQEANTENLDDTFLARNQPLQEYESEYIYGGGLTEGYVRNHPIIKFNISLIPENVDIDEAYLYLYLAGNFLDAGENVTHSAHHVYSFPAFNVSDEEWVEGNSWGGLATPPEISWSTRPTTESQYNTTIESNRVFTSDTEISTFYNWSITKMINSAYNNNNKNITIWLYGSEYVGDLDFIVDIGFFSKETATSSYRPYINITYSEAEEDTTPPVITLLSPHDNSDDFDGIVLFEYNVADDSNISTCSIYTDNHFQLRDTSITTNISQSFEITNPIINSNLEWYILCNDTLNNVGNSTTWTVNTRPPVSWEANPVYVSIPITLYSLDIIYDKEWCFDLDNNIKIRPVDSDGNLTILDDIIYHPNVTFLQTGGLYQEELVYYITLQPSSIEANSTKEEITINITATQNGKTITETLNISIRDCTTIEKFVINTGENIEAFWYKHKILIIVCSIILILIIISIIILKLKY